MKYEIKNVVKKDGEVPGNKIEFAYFDVDIYDADDKLITTKSMSINGNAFISVEEELEKIEAVVQKFGVWTNLKKSLETGKKDLNPKEV